MAASALALAPAFFTSAALAQAAGTERGVSAIVVPASAVSDDSELLVELARAKTLVEGAQLVHAKEALSKLVSMPAMKTASAGTQGDVLDLISRVETRIRNLDQYDLSLQKAAYAIDTGNFVEAERHAKAVLKKSTLGVQRMQAQETLDTLESRRQELAPLVANALTQMVDDFRAGRYSQAKGCIYSIQNTGLELSSEHRELMTTYQDRILVLERKQDRMYPFETAGLAVFQPGVVRRDRRGDEPTPAPAPAPEPVPADNTTTEIAYVPQPEPTPAQPEPAPAPVPQPTPAEVTPSQPAGQQDLITQALRADAQRILAEADQNMRESRFNLAQNKYLQLLGSYRQYLSPEDVATAEAKLAEARIKLNQGQAVGDVIQEIVLVRDATRAEFNNSLAQAEQALAAGNVGRARDNTAAAGLAYSKNKQHFNPQEQSEEFEKPLQAMRDRITSEETRIVQREQEIKQGQMEREIDERAARLMSEKQRKINEEIDRARALQQEQKYKEALQVVEHILFLDPRNPTALLLADAYRSIIVYQEYHDIQRAKVRHATNQTLDAERAMIPPDGILDYSKDWPSISRSRGDYSGYAETAENRRTLTKLETRVPVNFRDNSVEDIFRYITSLTDVAIDAEWDSLRDLGINPDTTVNYSLSAQLPASTVLDRVLGKISTDSLNRAGWAVSDGMVRIASQDVLNQDRTLVLYDIQDLLFDIPNYEETPQIDLQSLLQQSQQGGGGGGQSPFQDNQDNQEGRDPDRPTREERITLIRQIITSNVDPEGWTEGGGEVGTIQELNGQLIINNTPKNHRAIVGLLSKLRATRAMQINVETKFLLVNQSWFEQIGFDVDLVLNANNNQFRAVRATQPTAQPSDMFNFSSSTGRRGLQRVVPGRDIDGDGNTDGPGEGAAGVVNPTRWSPFGFMQDSLGLTNSLVEGDFATSIIGASPALGISGQFLDDIQVDFLITATQADKRTVQLTAPRLTFTNAQTANIFVVTQQAFVSDLQPVVGDSAVGFDPDVAVASEGVTMLMEGVISADRRYVTLNVDAGVGRIDGFEQAAVTAVAGGQLVNSADTQSFIQLPTITVTRVRTSVTVPDEGTVLLGGQRLITELEVETGVPVLSKIPIINRFFTNRVESKEEQTLLILLKPTILIQAEQEEKNFPGINDSLQLGLR